MEILEDVTRPQGESTWDRLLQAHSTFSTEALMADKLDRYQDILNRLISETVKCTPREWTRGTLTIDCDGARINYKLKNPDQSGAASISEKLRDIIDELYVVMAQQGDLWKEAVVSFSLPAEDEVHFETNFSYDSAQPKPTPASAPKPRWKFW